MAKRHIRPLQVGRIRLRLLDERDLPLTLSWRNQGHIRRWFFFSQPLTMEQHVAWFASYQQRDDDFVFVVEEASERQRPIGQAALYHIDWFAGKAEFGRLMIGEADAAGRGLAREATQTLVAMAFEELGLREVYLEVLPDNERAINVYRACGFEVAGRTERAVRMCKRAAIKRPV